jgi:MinD-like ATPase involved in chromosome partitioning or flagellar assembly
MTIHLHGAQPVPVTGAAPARWSPAGVDDTGEIPLRAIAEPTAVPRVPDDRREVVKMALRPLRQWATVPIVGVEGGAGRTTVTRLLGRAFMTVRKAKLAAVDAVPLWGGLTAAVARPAGTGMTVQDVAAMEWPPQMPVEQLLTDGFAGDGPVRTVTSRSFAQAGWANSDELDLCVRRVSALVDLTLVDTVADPLSSPARTFITNDRTTPVWVCTATRDGLWGVGEAIAFLERRGAANLAARSVVAMVGHHRRWPREAAAAEAQLTGHGLEIIRVPFSTDPLHNRRCWQAGVRLLAAVVARSG